MWKIVARIRRRPDLSHAQFRAYYEAHHVPLAVEYLKGIAIGYSRNYISQASRYAPEDPDWLDAADRPADYDCITIVEFADRPSLDRVMALLASPEVAKVIVPDEERFIDRSATEFAICEEETSGTRPADLRSAA